MRMLSWCGAAALGVAACWSGRAEAADATLLDEKVTKLRAEAEGQAGLQPALKEFAVVYKKDGKVVSSWSSKQESVKVLGTITWSIDGELVAAGEVGDRLDALAVCGGTATWAIPKEGDEKTLLASGTVKFTAPSGVRIWRDGDQEANWTHDTDPDDVVAWAYCGSNNEVTFSWKGVGGTQEHQTKAKRAELFFDGHIKSSSHVEIIAAQNSVAKLYQAGVEQVKYPKLEFTLNGISSVPAKKRNLSRYFWPQRAADKLKVEAIGALKAGSVLLVYNRATTGWQKLWTLTTGVDLGDHGAEALGVDASMIPTEPLKFQIVPFGDPRKNLEFEIHPDTLVRADAVVLRDRPRHRENDRRSVRLQLHNWGTYDIFVIQDGAADKLSGAVGIAGVRLERAETKADVARAAHASARAEEAVVYDELLQLQAAYEFQRNKQHLIRRQEWRLESAERISDRTAAAANKADSKAKLRHRDYRKSQKLARQRHRLRLPSGATPTLGAWLASSRREPIIIRAVPSDGKGPIYDWHLPIREPLGSTPWCAPPSGQLPAYLVCVDASTGSLSTIYQSYVAPSGRSPDYDNLSIPPNTPTYVVVQHGKEARATVAGSGTAGLQSRFVILDPNDEEGGGSPVNVDNKLGHAADDKVILLPQVDGKIYTHTTQWLAPRRITAAEEAFFLDVTVQGKGAKATSRIEVPTQQRYYGALRMGVGGAWSNDLERWDVVDLGAGPELVRDQYGGLVTYMVGYSQFFTVSGRSYSSPQNPWYLWKKLGFYGGLGIASPTANGGLTDSVASVMVGPEVELGKYVSIAAGPVFARQPWPRDGFYEGASLTGIKKPDGGELRDAVLRPGWTPAFGLTVNLTPSFFRFAGRSGIKVPEKWAETVVTTKTSTEAAPASAATEAK